MKKLALIVPLVVVTAACSPAQRGDIPVLSTIDAIGMSVSRVMRWCEDAGGRDHVLYAKAVEAYEKKDYRQALALVSSLATELRKNGRDVPDEAFVTIKVVEGALAAQAIDDGMSALSAPPNP